MSNALSVMSNALDAEDLMLLLLAIDLLDRHTGDELAKANNAKQAAIINTRSRLLIVGAKLRMMQEGRPMHVVSEIPKARATAWGLRATAQACTREQSALKLRLMQAADELNNMAALVLYDLERIDKLEQELAQLKAGQGAPDNDPL